MEGSLAVIGNGVYVGPNSVIAMGVTIGDCVVIGAMAFVHKLILRGKRHGGARPSCLGNVEFTPRDLGVVR
jgi:tetrahydrodipicolinate N-succinyltransferase